MDNPPSNQNNIQSIKIQEDNLANPIKLIDPDSWNNIPICIVKAFKQVIMSSTNQDMKMKILHNSIDQQKRRDQQTMSRLDKDLQRKEEFLAQQIKQLEKSVDQHINNMNITINNEIQQIKEKSEAQFFSSQSLYDVVNTKLDRVEDGESIRNWAKQLINIQLSQYTE